LDPSTIVVVLATQLLCTGGLFHLIGREMPPRCGLQLWASGLGLFGAAYMVRIALRSQVAPGWLLPADAAMFGAALLFVAGLRQFVGTRAFARRAAAVALAGFVLAEAAAIAVHGATGRHVALNLGLGLMYVWLAVNAGTARDEVDERLSRPLLMLTALTGILGLLTLARAAHIAATGVASAMEGAFAKVYYAYAALAAMLLAMCLLWMVFVRLAGQLGELATHDALTRVLNRTGLEEALHRHFGARPAQPLTLLAVDVDHFKRINDEHGHAAGDAALREIAAVLLRHLRAHDLVARLGGEEFVVCTAAPDADAALALAERLRAAVADAELALDGGATLRCTVSIGVSPPCRAAAGWDAAFAVADRALYAAKAAGRDRVVAVAPAAAT
jgi:diguanylate cyclase (GGDEF)-like protein